MCTRFDWPEFDSCSLSLLLHHGTAFFASVRCRFRPFFVFYAVNRRLPVVWRRGNRHSRLRSAAAAPLNQPPAFPRPFSRPAHPFWPVFRGSAANTHRESADYENPGKIRVENAEKRRVALCVRRSSPWLLHFRRFSTNGVFIFHFHCHIRVDHGETRRLVPLAACAHPPVSRTVAVKVQPPVDACALPSFLRLSRPISRQIPASLVFLRSQQRTACACAGCGGPNGVFWGVFYHAECTTPNDTCYCAFPLPFAHLWAGFLGDFVLCTVVVVRCNCWEWLDGAAAVPWVCFCVVLLTWCGTVVCIVCVCVCVQ